MAETLYVNGQRSQSGNGKSWDQAYKTLSEALLKAGTSNEIWIAKGTYNPDPKRRDASFLIRSGISIYGGFRGDESTRSQRDWKKNATILSGDIREKEIRISGAAIH